MENKINLCEILKGHEGEIFYSSTFGTLTLNCINNGIISFSILSQDTDKTTIVLMSNGFYTKDGELCIFPSKYQRDWNAWIDKNKYIEEQKNKTPKTWSALVKSNNWKIYGIECADINDQYLTRDGKTPIEKSALALLKIHQLIEVGYSGNATKKDFISQAYTIYVDVNETFGIVCTNEPCPIAFRDDAQAEEFLSYPENIQLLKDYFMI